MNTGNPAVLIGAAVIILAAIAYFFLAGTNDAPSPTTDVPQKLQQQ